MWLVRNPACCYCVTMRLAPVRTFWAHTSAEHVGRQPTRYSELSREHLCWKQGLAPGAKASLQNHQAVNMEASCSTHALAAAPLIVIEEYSALAYKPMESIEMRFPGIVGADRFELCKKLYMASTSVKL